MPPLLLNMLRFTNILKSWGKMYSELALSAKNVHTCEGFFPVLPSFFVIKSERHKTLKP